MIAVDEENIKYFKKGHKVIKEIWEKTKDQALGSVFSQDELTHTLEILYPDSMPVRDEY